MVGILLLRRFSLEFSSIIKILQQNYNVSDMDYISKKLFSLYEKPERLPKFK
jgi:hypothetical protein